jgi:vacuolar-type H+-ATPase subunit E/Vma4
MWLLMPDFPIDEIFMYVSHSNRNYLYKKFHELYICSYSYTKVLESMEKNTDGSFNPFQAVGEVATDMNIETLFQGVETKTLSAYEMLMEQIVNQQIDGKMKDYMENIKEDDVNQAADKLTDVLNSDNFKGNKQTTKIISNMLGKIKDEVINLKNEPLDKVKGKQGVEQLLGIAQKVAGNMMSSIRENNIDVLDLWDATSNLAKSTTNSDALNIVDKLIRSNIQNNMKQAQAQVQIPPNNTETTTNTQTTNNTETSNNTETKNNSKIFKKKMPKI